MATTVSGPKKESRNASRKTMESAKVAVFQNMVACLTGMSAADKDRLHALIENMGGSYTRDLDFDKTTHLVAVEPSGEKYEAAAQSFVAVGGQAMIRIVKPSWIEECWKEQQLVDWKRHKLYDDGSEDNEFGDGATNNCDTALIKTSVSAASWEYAMDDLLSDIDMLQHRNNWLFSTCHFLLIGFGSTSDNDKSGQEFIDENNKTSHCDAISMYDKLRRLLRRCMATIHWEMNDGNTGTLTHAIIPDKVMDEETRSAMVTRTKDHGISLVSPRWVVESCQRGKRLSWSAVYLPECRQTTAPNADSDAVIKLDKESRKRRRSQKGEVSDSSSVGVFRGCVFVLLRVAPPVERVDFAVSDVEAMITGPPGGGQILTRDVLDDMQSRNTKKASAASSEQPNKQQTCYVVCWGGECGTGSSSFGGADDDDGSGTTSWPKLEDRHPLLWQLKQQRLCHIVHTTPIWVQTCLTEQKRIAPKRYPELFQPTNYPLHLLSHKQTLHSNHHDSETSKMLDVTCPTTDMRISLTGFVGWQRSALIHFLQAMGATYDDALHPNTTHLLVADTVVQQNDNETLQQQRGAKYEKAVEWKISIVTLEWLYQGARCGFPNDSKTVDDNSDT